MQWTSDDDLSNPLNFPLPQKWTITLISSLGGLICLVSSTMLAPALPVLAADLHISREEAKQTLSIFVLAVAVGPSRWRRWRRCLGAAARGWSALRGTRCGVWGVGLRGARAWW